MNINTEDREFIVQALSETEGRMRKEMQDMEGRIRTDMATKEDLTRMASKRDLAEMEARFTIKIENEIEHLALLVQNEFSSVRKEFAR